MEAIKAYIKKYPGVVAASAPVFALAVLMLTDIGAPQPDFFGHHVTMLANSIYCVVAAAFLVAYGVFLLWVRHASSYDYILGLCGTVTLPFLCFVSYVFAT